MEAVTAWIAAHAPAYYGPALAAFVVVYHFTSDFSHRYVRNLLRGAVFALLLGSKFVVTAAGVSPVPLWQHALSGSAGFALAALVFWTIGGFGVAQLLDAMVEVLKAATKAVKNSVISAAVLIAFGGIGALATAPLGRMLDARWAPPAVQVPVEAIPAVIEAINASPSAAPAAAAPAPSTAAPSPGMISTVDALMPPAPAAPTAPPSMPATAPMPTPAPADAGSSAPAASPTTSG